MGLDQPDPVDRAARVSAQPTARAGYRESAAAHGGGRSAVPAEARRPLETRVHEPLVDADGGRQGVGERRAVGGFHEQRGFAAGLGQPPGWRPPTGTPVAIASSIWQDEALVQLN